jgi:hypothetical protein
MSRKATGIEIRHESGCPATQGLRCNCSPAYRAVVSSAADKRRVTKTFRTLSEAKAWRADAQSALRQGTLSGAKSSSLAEAAAVWLIGAEAGSIRNRSGDAYKPSAL